jgi:hypothetical protein
VARHHRAADFKKEEVMARIHNPVHASAIGLPVVPAT